MQLINNALLYYIAAGFVCNTLLTIPVLFMKEIELDMEMWIATMLTWPYTLFKLFKRIVKQ